MSCLAQVHPALIVHNRRPCTHPVSKLCFRKDHIQLHQHGIVQIDIFPMSGSLRRQFCQNPLDFLLFLQFQFPQRIIGIDRRHRLNEVSAAGGGNIMDKTGNIIAALGFYRHHITSATHGNDRLSQELAVGRRRNHLLQTVTNLARLNAHMAANVSERRRCVIRNLFLGQNCAEDLIFQIFIRGQGCKERIQNRCLIVLGHIALDVSGAAQHTGNPQQLNGLQASATVCPFQRCGYIGYVTKNGVALSGAKVRCGSGLLQH